MRQEEIFANKGGINGSPTGDVDTTNPAFFALRAAIEADAARQTPEVKKSMALRVLHIKMREYFESTEITDATSIGDWLSKYLEILKIKNKTFAKYLNIKEPNLSAILKNRRKINIDFALKLEQLFDIKAEIWLGIQLKNELAQVEKKEEKEYKIEELMKLCA